MDLFRDLLDARLLDRCKRPLGRVDGLTLELRDGHPPRVVSMEVGAGRLADRIHPKFGHIVRRVLMRRFTLSADATIPMDTIRNIGVDVEIDVDAEQQPALLQTEKAFRPIVRHIPGGGT